MGQIIGAVIHGLLHMDRQVMDATVARHQTEDSSRKYKTEEERCSALSSRIEDVNSKSNPKELKKLTKDRIKNINNHISNLNLAEVNTQDYKENNFIGKFDQSPARVLWMIENLRTAYTSLLEQQVKNLNHLKAL